MTLCVIPGRAEGAIPESITPVFLTAPVVIMDTGTRFRLRAYAL
jgi:hypothetical protein